jgi:glycosyltransferase involved in cell wall biosynthesis
VGERIYRRDEGKRAHLVRRPPGLQAESRGAEPAQSGGRGDQAGPSERHDRERGAHRKERNRNGKEPRLRPAVAIEEDDATVHGMSHEGAESLSRRVATGKARRDVNIPASSHVAQDRRVVVRAAEIRVARSKPSERLEQQRPRREEARRALRIPVEVVDPEARRSRVVEVLAPRQLRQQRPELAEGRLADHVHVAGPHVLAPSEPIGDERKGVGLEAYSSVEEENELGLRLAHAAPASRQAPEIRLPEHASRHAVDESSRHDLPAAVRRPVVDDDELGLEPASLDGYDKSLQRGWEVSSLVVDRHDDAETLQVRRHPRLALGLRRYRGAVGGHTDARVASPLTERARASSFAIVANGFADGPAQALRDYLRARDADVLAVSHPLTPQDGGRHVVERWAGDDLVSLRSVGLPIRPPASYALDPLVPLRHRGVDVWFGFNPLACARGMAARRLGKAGSVVLWSVDFVPDRFGPGTARTRMYDALDRLCCTRADARIELTHAALEARNRRHGLHGRTTRAHVVPMGAWLDRVPKVGTEGYRSRRIVLLAHLVRRQGADVLLEALALLATRRAGITADVIGTGPLEPELRARASELGLDGVVDFHGFLPDHREVERRLASASVGVAPYRPGEATFTTHADPGKIKAYLAAGLPVLLTDVPPNATELAAEGGAEIVPFDARALADATLRLLDSPQTWQSRSTAALAYSQQFDWTLLLDGLMGGLGIEVVGGSRA